MRRYRTCEALSKTRPLRFEKLESRQLLSVGNAFAVYQGVIAAPGHAGQNTAAISSSVFSLTGGSVRLGFQVEAQGGGLDPAAVVLRDSSNFVVSPLYSTNNVAADNSSLVIADLTADTYQIQVQGEASSAGQYEIHVFLVGDADNNRQVDQFDVNLIRSTFGTMDADIEYLVSADANLDGRITSFDLAQWVRNRGESTSIDPNWGITMNSSPLSAVLTSGALGTTLSAVNIVGTTLPGRVVELDADGDGQYDDGSDTAETNGEYSISTPLGVGENRLTVRTQDPFGQSRINTLVVERVASLPSTAQVFENYAVDRTGGGTSDEGTQRLATFDIDPGWEQVGSQNFGYSDTNNVGLGQGEIGGPFFRDPLSYYADQIDELDPNVDSLSLSGTAAITQVLSLVEPCSNLWGPAKKAPVMRVALKSDL